jgi:hypothetical protein
MFNTELFFADDTNILSLLTIIFVIGVLNNLKYLHIALLLLTFLWIEQKKSEWINKIYPALVPIIINFWYCAIWLTIGCNRSVYWMLLIKRLG